MLEVAACVAAAVVNWGAVLRVLPDTGLWSLVS